jgi:ribonuclease BN (tRNA processing enzyme)
MKTLIWFFGVVILFTFCTKDYYENEDSKGSKIQSYSSKVTKIVLLGTGTPNPQPERSGPAVAIIVNNQAYLVDCGPGIIRRASAAFNKGVQALGTAKLNKLFLTHLHSDHTAGLPDLILSSWVLGRKEHLKVWGPTGTKKMVEHLTEAYREDINNRLSGLEPIDKEGYKTDVTEFDEGLIYQDSNVNVYAYRVEHGEWKNAYAFQFITPDRVITISGDCKPCDGIYAASMGCDILIHEVYSYAGFLTRKADWQVYHKASHTSTYELADLANKVKPKKLILYHILSWGASPENILLEIKQNYKGDVICGSDLDIY